MAQRCATFHPLIIKGIWEVISDFGSSLIIILFKLLLQVRPKNLGNIIIINL